MPEKEELQNQNQEEVGRENRRKIWEWRRSSEWKAARDLLVQKLILIDSCTSIDDNISNTEAGELARVNKKVFQTISEWIAEIEGEADAFKQMVGEVQETKKEGDIYRTVDTGE